MIDDGKIILMRQRNMSQTKSVQIFKIERLTIVINHIKGKFVLRLITTATIRFTIIRLPLKLSVAPLSYQDTHYFILFLLYY